MAHATGTDMEPDPPDEVLVSTPGATSFKDKLLGSQGMEVSLHQNMKEDPIHGEWLVVSQSKKPGIDKGKGKERINSKNKGNCQSKAPVFKKNQFSALSNIQQECNVFYGSNSQSFQFQATTINPPSQSFSKKKRHRVYSNQDSARNIMVLDNVVKSLNEGKENSAIEKNNHKDFGIKTAMNVQVISQNRMRFVDMNDQVNAHVEDNSALQLKGYKSPSNQDSPEDELDPMLEVLVKAVGIQPPRG
ncbi:hypothetical protein SESBI_05569 [Sesbania bispinosa]|nr:hypothetical protein SESBI_05569 [Sesbania bispinosa]